MEKRNIEKNSREIIWSGSYAALVEMLYGCLEIGYFSNSNVALHKLVDTFCEFLDIKKGNPTLTYQDLKARKCFQIKFFEEAG